MKTSTIQAGGRSTAEYIGERRIQFTHPCGHVSVKDYSKGPRPSQVGEAGCRVMVKMWRSSGVIAECEVCRKA